MSSNAYREPLERGFYQITDSFAHCFPRSYFPGVKS